MKPFPRVTALSDLYHQVTHYQNAKVLAEVSEGLGPAMVGLTM
jgi:pyridoxal biosynthesis lyase PdxS